VKPKSKYATRYALGPGFGYWFDPELEPERCPHNYDNACMNCRERVDRSARRFNTYGLLILCALGFVGCFGVFSYKTYLLFGPANTAENRKLGVDADRPMPNCRQHRVDSRPDSKRDPVGSR